MHYIIQKNVFKDPRYEEIFAVMNRLGLSYEEVSFRPNSHIFDYQTDRKDVFVYGSVKLAKVAADYDWHPGSFYGERHSFVNYVKGYQQHALNFGSQILTLSEPIDWKAQAKLFIKPSKDAKVFTGKVFSKPEWEDFVYYSLQDRSNPRITARTEIQVSKPHRLIKEARVWVVGNQPVTSSYYLFHGDVEFEEELAPDGLAFAREMAALHEVADAYVLDIVLTAEGLSLIHISEPTRPD